MLHYIVVVKGKEAIQIALFFFHAQHLDSFMISSRPFFLESVPLMIIKRGLGFHRDLPRYDNIVQTTTRRTVLAMQDNILVAFSCLACYSGDGSQGMRTASLPRFRRSACVARQPAAPQRSALLASAVAVEWVAPAAASPVVSAEEGVEADLFGALADQGIDD